MAEIVTELSCYMDNRPGVIAMIAQKLAEKNVDVKGIQNYEGQLQSLVTMVVDNDEEAEKILRGFGVELVTINEVISLEIKNKVGGLAAVTKLLGDNNINLDSCYLTDSNGDCNIAYLRVADNEKALKVLNTLQDC